MLAVGITEVDECPIGEFQILAHLCRRILHAQPLQRRRPFRQGSLEPMQMRGRVTGTG